jgi:hypothetical protein
MGKKVQGASGKQYELWEESEVKEARERKVGYEAVTVEQVREWSREVQHKAEVEKERCEKDKWKEQAEGARSQVAVLLGLIEEYGLCRPELQVARMGLDEGYKQWKDKELANKEKDFMDTLGRFAKAIAKEMKKKGEL